MREDDKQQGWPFREYRDTKANVAALGLGAADEGCTAYATDTDELGTYDGAAWAWGTLSGLPNVAAAGYALVSDGVNSWAVDQTPLWTGEHSFEAGVAFVGASGVNEITVPDNIATALELLDAGGLEYMRIVSTDANPYFLIDPAGAGIKTGIGTAAPTGALTVEYLTVDTTVNYYGLWNKHIKTAGVTTEADDIYGIYNYVEMNHGGSTIGHLTASLNYAILTAGTIGDGQEELRGGTYAAIMSGGTVNKSVSGLVLSSIINAGVIANDVFGVVASVDIDAAVTSIGGNVYGMNLFVDADTDPTGTVYMLFLNEGSNIDYGIYQSGSADNYFGGNVGIGADPGAKLDVDGGAADDPLVILDALSDDDSAFINFKGVSAANFTKSISTAVPWSFVGHIRIQINNADYWIPYYTPL